MARKIISYNPLKQKRPSILGKKTKRVSDISSKVTQKVIFELNDSLDRLITKYGILNGIGLAAPQINSNLRIAVIQLPKKRVVMINPKVIKKSKDSAVSAICCFSVQRYCGNIEHPKRIKIFYLDEKGKKRTYSVPKKNSVLFSHEIDHLNGILIVDRVKNKLRGLYKIAPKLN